MGLVFVCVWHLWVLFFFSTVQRDRPLIQSYGCGICFWGGVVFFWLWNNNILPNAGMSWKNFTPSINLYFLSQTHKSITHSRIDRSFEIQLYKFPIFALAHRAQESNAKNVLTGCWVDADIQEVVCLGV